MSYIPYKDIMAGGDSTAGCLCIVWGGTQKTVRQMIG